MIFEKLAKRNSIHAYYKQSFELKTTLIIVYNFCCKSLRENLSKVEIWEPIKIKKYTKTRISNNVIYLYFTFEVNQVTLVAKVIVKEINEKFQKEFTLTTSDGGHCGVSSKNSKITKAKIAGDFQY